MLLTLLLCAILIAVTTGAWFVGQDALRLLRRDAAEKRWGIIHVALVAAVTILAYRLRWQVTPHHVMYLDEPWYIEAAQSILRWRKPLLCEQHWEGLSCVVYPKSVGWPLLLAGTFAFTGVSDLTAIHLTTVLGSLSVPIAAMCTRDLGGTRLQSLLAAILVAFYPTHVLWSATAETNVAGAFFVLLALWGLVRVQRDGPWPALLLAASSLCVASAVRPETAWMFFPAALVVLAARKTTPSTRWRFAALVLVLAAAGAMAAIAPMWRLNVEIAHGAGFLALGRVTESLRALPGPTLAFHALLVVLASCAFIGHRSLLAAATFGAGLAQMLVALAFHQFADRLLLSGAIALVPLAAMFPGLWMETSTGRSWREFFAPAVTLLAVAWIAVLARRNVDSAHLPESQVLETSVPSLVRNSVQSDSALVVAEMPAVVAHASAAPVMATETALSHGAAALVAVAEQRPVYFVCDMYCEAGFGGGTGPAACSSALRDLELERVSVTALHGRRYGIYRVRGERKSEAPVRACP